MRTVTFEPTIKQFMCLKKLYDKTTEEILFGGAGGGGKTALGCFWLISSSMHYPGSRWLLGRAVLKDLKQTTVKSLLGMLSDIFGFRAGVEYRYNSQEGQLTFHNGSEIVLKDLASAPSDPNFDTLGSSEYTGAFIDEASEVAFKAKDILLTRLRYLTKKYGIMGKLLICSNPAKNFMYSEFYLPWKKKELPKTKCFIPALAGDNPYLDPNYIPKLKRRSEATKQRLLYGNWEYDSDKSKLCEYDAIVDIFTNTFIKGGKKYLSSDIAMQGRDNFIVSVWNGLRCKIPIIKNKAEPDEIERDIKAEAMNYEVPNSQIVADSSGMREYLRGYIKNIKPFRGGERAINSKEYANLRSECGFKLAELINQRKIHIICDTEITKQTIIEEIEQLKLSGLYSDESKKRLIKKEVMQKNLRRSPDFLDVLMMRMIFEIKPKVPEISAKRSRAF